jgi:phosphate-selective porin
LGDHFFPLTHGRRPGCTARIVLVAWAATLPSIAQGPGAEIEHPPRPSWRAADWLKLDFRVKIQADFRGRPFQETSDELFDPRRLRLGAGGRIFDDLEFEVEFDVRPSNHQIRDAFLNYRRFGSVQLRAGKFRVPFGRDQLTDPLHLDFVYRSRVGALLAPGRDVGAMVHGALFEGGLGYSAGVFRHDGEIAEVQDFTQERDYVPTGNRTVAARVTGRPSGFLRAPAALEKLEIGAAFTRSEVPSGLNSLRGRSVSGEVFFPTMFVQGVRRRAGAELSWRVRSLALQGEYMSVREERRGQGLQGADLPALLATGWYLSATHPLLGRRDFGKPGWIGKALPGLRRGLVEAAARYEQIRFGGEGSGGLTPSRSPRAAEVAANRNRGWTLGLNWYAARYTKLQFNAMHETFLDPVRTPVAGVNGYWTLAGRIQFGF